MKNIKLPKTIEKLVDSEVYFRSFYFLKGDTYFKNILLIIIFVFVLVLLLIIFGAVL